MIDYIILQVGYMSVSASSPSSRGKSILIIILSRFSSVDTSPIKMTSIHITQKIENENEKHSRYLETEEVDNMNLHCLDHESFDF